MNNFSINLLWGSLRVEPVETSVILLSWIRALSIFCCSSLAWIEDSLLKIKETVKISNYYILACFTASFSALIAANFSWWSFSLKRTFSCSYSYYILAHLPSTLVSLQFVWYFSDSFLACQGFLICSFPVLFSNSFRFVPIKVNKNSNEQINTFFAFNSSWTLKAFSLISLTLSLKTISIINDEYITFVFVWDQLDGWRTLRSY